MSTTFLKDIYLTNSILNFLFAGYQGAFAALNLLSQLSAETFNSDELSRVERHLNEIEKWKDDLMKGLPIFSSGWEAPQTVASRKAFETLAELRSELTKVAGHVKKSLLVEDLYKSPEDVKYLIGAYARQAYARENYVRGLIEFGQSFKHQDIIDSYSQFLPQAEQSLEVTHMFVNILVSGEDLLPVFFKGLHEECMFLPGIFQAQVHDINILLNTFVQPLSYDKLGIIPQHKDAWSSINISPVMAGYWQAWEFSPEVAANWIESGFEDPKTAWFWNVLGFNFKEALDWLSAGFSPPSAKEWRDKGHLTPQSAIEELTLIQKAQERSGSEAVDEWTALKEENKEAISEEAPGDETQPSSDETKMQEAPEPEPVDEWSSFKEKHKQGLANKKSG